MASRLIEISPFLAVLAIASPPEVSPESIGKRMWSTSGTGHTLTQVTESSYLKFADIDARTQASRLGSRCRRAYSDSLMTPPLPDLSDRLEQMFESNGSKGQNKFRDLGV